MTGQVQYLSCEHPGCESLAVITGCPALGRTMRLVCPKTHHAALLESLCDDPWGILGRYVEVKDLPFCASSATDKK
jgi:hypothetical protein